ncbi:MAG: hypothetical protein HYZ79_02120 [Candidatus Melainabacteria bacterium]|nr:hypothetical protein [Candidatus Melainabacteria bacterium]
MRSNYRKKLDGVIEDLSFFLKKDYSSRFKDLSASEDRQLFFFANILAKLKIISSEIKHEEKVLIFPYLTKNDNGNKQSEEELLPVP